MGLAFFRRRHAETAEATQAPKGKGKGKAAAKAAPKSSPEPEEKDQTTTPGEPTAADI